MVTLTIFARKIKIYTRRLYYYDANGFTNSEQFPNYRKVQNVIQSVEIFFCDNYLNTDFFQEFTFLKKLGDFVFIEFTFENEKEYFHFLRANPALYCKDVRNKIIDNENNIHCIFDLEDVSIVYEYEEVELL
jgi:hypothetical protein